MTECGAQFWTCRCGRTDEHEVHACGQESAITTDGRCHGQWRDGGKVVQFPTGAWTEQQALADAEAWLLTGKKIEPRGDVDQPTHQPQTGDTQ